MGRLYLTEEHVEKIYKMRMQSMTPKVIAKELGISSCSVSNVTRYFRNEGVKFPCIGGRGISYSKLVKQFVENKRQK